MGLISQFKAFRKRAKKEEKDDFLTKEMTFLDHLEELRWHLVRSLVVVGLIAIGMFVYVQTLLEKVILAPFSPDFPMHRFLCGLRTSLCFERIDVDFIAIDPYEQFLKAFGIALLGGFIVAFPYIVWEVWRFIKPGLHPHEQKKLRGNVWVISFLFLAGVLFAYYIITPFSVTFLSNFKLAVEIQNQWKIGKVISLVSQIAIAGGVLFELPILVYYLSLAGVVTPDMMRTYRKHAIVVLLILAAIITPPDWLSQMLIFFPLVLLYQASLRICIIVTNRRLKQEAAEARKLATQRSEA